MSLCKVYHWWWMVIDTSTPRANQAWIPSTQQSHYPPFITQFPPDDCCICCHALSALHHQFFVVRKGCFVLGGRCRMACGGSFSLLYIFSSLPLSYIDTMKLLVAIFCLRKGVCCLWWLGGLLQRKSSWWEQIWRKMNAEVREKSKQSCLFGGALINYQ